MQRKLRAIFLVSIFSLLSLSGNIYGGWHFSIKTVTCFNILRFFCPCFGKCLKKCFKKDNHNSRGKYLHKTLKRTSKGSFSPKFDPKTQKVNNVEFIPEVFVKQPEDDLEMNVSVQDIKELSGDISFKEDIENLVESWQETNLKN